MADLPPEATADLCWDHCKAVHDQAGEDCPWFQSEHNQPAKCPRCDQGGSAELFCWCPTMDGPHKAAQHHKEAKT